MVSSLNSAALIAWVTAVGLPKFDDGSGSWVDSPGAVPSAMPLQRASVFAAPGRVFTQRTFLTPLCAKN